MATVKSLEERLDEFTDEVAGVAAKLDTVVAGGAATQTQLAVLTARVEALTEKFGAVQGQLATLAGALSATQAQIAVLTARLDALADALRATGVRLDGTTAKLDGVVAEHAALRSKSDTTLGLVKWVGAFVAGVFLALLASGFTVVRAAGHVEAAVEQHQKSLDEIRRELAEIRTKQK